MTYYHD